MQTADVEIKNDIAITIHKFEESYRRDANGVLVAYDTITYSPRGDIKTVLDRDVGRMSKVYTLEECGDNLAALAAYRLWQTIKPQYEYWKLNQQLPVNGTPLGAWGGASAAQAKVLKEAGLTTVEEVASASDIVLNKIGLANGLQLRELAKKFLANETKVNVAAVLDNVEQENAALKEQLADQQRQIAEMMALLREQQADKPEGKATSKQKAA